MDEIELKPSELLRRVNNLKKAGFNVTVESNEAGWVLKVCKTESRKEMESHDKDFFYY